MSGRRRGLTAAFCAKVTEPGKHYDEHGLYLKVSPSGRRYFEQRVMVGRKRRTLGLGRYPVVTLAMARTWALGNLRDAWSGIDVVAKRRQAAPPTLAQAAAKALPIRARTWRREITKVNRFRAFDRHVTASLGHHLVSEITTAEIQDLLVALAERQPGVAVVVRSDLRYVFKWVIAQGYRSDNPAGRVLIGMFEGTKAQKTKDKPPAVKAKDIGRAYLKVERACSKPALFLWFQLMVFTAGRSTELRLATWDEFDLEGKRWELSGERMKNGDEHTVPLSKPALEVLALVRALRPDSEFLFLSKADKPYGTSALSELFQKAKVGSTPHRLRATFLTWCKENGVDHFASEMSLAHRVGSPMFRAYLDTDLYEQRRKIMKKWAKYVLRCVAEARAEERQSSV